jgi:hypothetical protein
MARCGGDVPRSRGLFESLSRVAFWGPLELGMVLDYVPLPQ